ncbi:MAG: HAD hydrolase-like protein [Candidatus Binatia bacterium]
MSRATAAARAVLWDMDGTLVDSGDLHFATWRDVLAERGHALTRAEFDATFGQPSTRCCAEDLHHRGHRGKTREYAFTAETRRTRRRVAHLRDRCVSAVKLPFFVFPLCPLCSLW